MKSSVIVFGPQSCGKTTNRHLIAQHLGLGKIVDGGAHVLAAREVLNPAPLDHLYLTDVQPSPELAARITTMPYDVVMAEIEGSAK